MRSKKGLRRPPTLARSRDFGALREGLACLLPPPAQGASLCGVLASEAGRTEPRSRSPDPPAGCPVGRPGCAPCSSARPSVPVARPSRPEGPKVDSLSPMVASPGLLGIPAGSAPARAAACSLPPHCRAKGTPRSSATSLARSPALPQAPRRTGHAHAPRRPRRPSADLQVLEAADPHSALCAVARRARRHRLPGATRDAATRLHPALQGPSPPVSSHSPCSQRPVYARSGGVRDPPTLRHTSGAASENHAFAGVDLVRALGRAPTSTHRCVDVGAPRDAVPSYETGCPVPDDLPAPHRPCRPSVALADPERPHGRSHLCSGTAEPGRLPSREPHGTAAAVGASLVAGPRCSASHLATPRVRAGGEDRLASPVMARLHRDARSRSGRLAAEHGAPGARGGSRGRSTRRCRLADSRPRRVLRWRVVRIARPGAGPGRTRGEPLVDRRPSPTSWD